ncbi:RNA polymerase sigma factor [Cognatishimia sp. SS12]|uniref:RNA polymerase sigma factor n=1 Tax=Cognatishimia sp. SS12 TaxID=2979465 RepID=UPI00232DC592|nr:RNA polymerase sigma factor [Cognatishimia sp. SS12]MDC0736892.1 RNA polymerase sigma factor [Cognatishimia sp. SS12]
MTEKRRALEEYLVAGARLNDRAAIADLVRLRGPRLLVHATRLLGNRDEAQDAVQDAWVEILRDISKLRVDAAFAAWATRIVTRRCARIISGNQRNRRIAQDLAPLTDFAAAPMVDDQAAVRRAIADLPAAQGAAVALFYLEDMSLAEVAVAMDVPLGTVKSRLSHARERLRESLKGAYHDTGHGA